MKYEQYIILAILFFLISACQPIIEEKEISETKTQTEKKINEIDVHDLEILVIDNCEYIFYKKSPNANKGFGFMAHKGNCKNSVHFYSQKSQVKSN